MWKTEVVPMTRLDTSFLVREPEEAYHAKSKDYLTSHRLGEFRRNPLLFRKKELGMVPEEDRPAYLLGRAAHVLILEGENSLADRYAVGGPVNPKTGEVYGSRTKAFQEWAESQGKPVLTDEQHALIENLHQSVQAHKHARELFSAGVPEGVVRANYASLPCQARLDWVNPSLGIVDLKTCDDLDWLQADARSYGYAHQLAFYRAVATVVVGDPLPVWLVAVEKKEPFRCGVWRMGDDILAIAQKENEEAIARLVKCRASDSWPTGYEDVRVFDYL
jgi:hypothetical protein